MNAIQDKMLLVAVAGLCLGAVAGVRESVDAGWARCMELKWSPKTSLVYERTPDKVRPAKAFDDGPDYFRFQENVPGKNHYGEGLADCALICGTALSGLVDRWDATHDVATKAQAAKVARGVLNLAKLHGFPGFVARGICVEDGKSICSLSSRDQYTHWAHGLFRYAKSGMADEAFVKEFAAEAVKVAEFMRAKCTPERNWNFGMCDGSADPRGICTMWGPDLAPHEQARLPMLYAVAWDLTGDAQWKAEYEKYADEALDKSQGMADRKATGKMPCYSLLQAQCSFELLKAIEKSPARVKKLDAAMDATARAAAGRAKVTLANPKVTFYGMCFDGELSLTMAMCPSATAADFRRDFLAQVVGREDLLKAGTCRNAHVLAAWWRAECNRARSAGDSAPVPTLGDAWYCTNGSWRTYCDFKVKADLADAKGISFETLVSDAKPFTGGAVYLRSGNGWYRAGFDMHPAGIWQRHVISKSDFTGTEGTPAGWRTISTVRIAYFYNVNDARARNARFEARALSSFGGNADVLVIRADSSLKRNSSDHAVSDYSATVSSTFDRIDVDSRQISDLDLRESSFRGVRLAVLPWNPSVPESVMSMLEKFVAGGGKLLVCGTYPSRVLKLLRMKNNGFWSSRSDPNGETIVGFVKCGDGLDGQPAFARQASWQTNMLEPIGEGQVIAVWRDGKGRDSKRSALVKTPAGFSLGHVWIGGEPGCDELMAAIVGDVIPEKRAKYLAACARLKACAEEERRWLATLPGKSGERRLMWCHSPFGMNGRDWDGAAKLMADGHFTDLVVNLVWGGSTAYRSDVWPAMASVATKGDQFEKCKAACRKHGIKLHVWQVCWRLGREVGKDEEARLAQEGRLQVERKNGKLSATRWLCPSHPRNREEVAAVMVELAKKGADGVHFDYIRYPDESSCFCPRCRELFEREIGAKIGNWPEDALRKHERAWLDFRKRFISDVVRQTAQAVHRDCPGVEVSAAVFRDPRAHGDADGVGQDWGTWCAEGLLDFVCPMDYVESVDAFRAIVEKQRELAGRAKMYPGIGISCWQQDGRRPQRLARQVLALRELGCDGFTMFEINGSNADEILPFLARGLFR